MSRVFVMVIASLVFLVPATAAVAQGMQTADDSLTGFTRVLDWGGIIDWPHETVSGSSPW